MMALAIVLAGAHVPGRVMAAAAPDLGDAGQFAVLAYAGVTNTGSTVIDGHVGVYPLTSITGFPPGVLLNGTIHVADGLAQAGQADLAVAYANLAGQAADYTYAVPTDLGGMTLSPGVYRFGSSAAITGALTLDAGSDLNPVWIFQIGSALTVTKDATVALQGAAACSRVFWQVGSSATLVTGATFVGDILAMESISMQSGASTTGRLLARTGAVTMIGNIVTPCDAPLEGALAIFKFYNADGLGEYDASTDIPLAGWEFYVADPTDELLNGGDPYTTNEDGFIVISGLDAGDYTAGETLKGGWARTSPVRQIGTVGDSGVTLLQFGNKLDKGVVGIFKFDDRNGNGTYEPLLGETPLEGWVFDVVNSSTRVAIDDSPFTTDASGFIVLTDDLGTARYNVTERVQDGWGVTTGNITQTVSGALGGLLYFGNMQDGQGILAIFKFNDVDGDEAYDPGDGETPLSNWEFLVDDGDTYSEYYTDATGLITLVGLVPGDYDVSETLKTYWIATTDNSQTVTVSNTEPARLNFGNRFYMPPRVVGGEASPVNKIALLMPWFIALAAVAGVSAVAKRRLRSDR